MPNSEAALTTDTIARIAAEVRQALAPGVAVTEAVPFGVLMDAVTLASPIGPLVTRARPHSGLRFTTFAVTEIDEALEEAWIWLNREAWPELCSDVPRTRATMAHELGHLSLHAAEFVELATLDAEPDHDARLDREAWALGVRLLIPDHGLHRLPRRRTDEVARRFGVTAQLAHRRIEEFERTA